MTAQAAIPLKWYVPFANNDSSRVELPVTTPDPTRASQSLGFPPLTMQPPESGGVPPQGEDFNGGMNQVARICWWLLNGGGYPYDSVFASNSNINGYPNGATLQSADFLGQWISIADNNQNNPDVSGASWVPGFQYGITSLTGLTGGTVTPTPAQAAKRAITLAGTLTSALTIILPTWLKDWTITNGTSGAFVTIVKTAAGSGITIPQNAQPTRVSGDGTNIVQAAENIAPATQSQHAVQLGQVVGVVGSMRNANMSVTAASASATFHADEIVVETALSGIPYRIGHVDLAINLGTTGAGGMDTGSAPTNGYVALYAIYSPTNGAKTLLGVNATSIVAPQIYGGANMPSGYTASALVGVWPTNASSQFVIGVQTDRTVTPAQQTVLSSGAAQASYTSLSIAVAVPANARSASGWMAGASTVAAGLVMNIAADANGLGDNLLQAYLNSTSGATSWTVPLKTAQTIFYNGTVSSGTANLTISVTGYTF